IPGNPLSGAATGPTASPPGTPVMAASLEETRNIAMINLIKRHPVLIFFLLAYALSWGAIPWHSFFAPGVLIAALTVVALTEGLAGLKAMGARLIRWRVSWIWYLVALA